MSQPNRRQLLKFLGMGGATHALKPLHVLVAGVVEGAMTRAYAQSAGINPRMLLYVQMYGSPPRWMYDQFLNPYNSSGFVANPAIGTRLTSSGGRLTGVSYDTVPVTKTGWADTIHAPWMWQFPLPAPGGTTRPMTDLLDNMLSIQGLDSLSDAHEAANLTIQQPLGALTSLAGLPVDYATTPIKAVESGSYRLALRTKMGASYASVGGSNYVSSLMTPFVNNASTSFQTKESQLKTAFSGAVSALAAAAKKTTLRLPPSTPTARRPTQPPRCCARWEI